MPLKACSEDGPRRVVVVRAPAGTAVLRIVQVETTTEALERFARERGHTADIFTRVKSSLPDAAKGNRAGWMKAGG